MDAYVYEYEIPIPFPADVETMFAALTEPEALKTWFSEHAEIEPKVGGDYKFWGKYTFGTAARAQASQKITRFEPSEALAFSWRMLDQDSIVTYSLKQDGDGQSRVAIKQEFAALPSGVRAKELIDDHWRLNSGNLYLYVEGQQKRSIYRPDYDDPNPEVRHEIEIEATPEQVFKALIVPENIKQWFPAPAPFVDPKVGGDYGFGFSFEKDGEKIDLPPMKILEFVENERLAITWPDWRGDASVPDQKVTWILEDLGGKTRLTLIHDGFTRAMDVSDYPFGWIEFIRKIRDLSPGL